MSTGTRAALGLRPHSGWAAMVAVTGSAQSPQIADRRRIALAGPGIPKQPYHAAEKLPLEEAETLVHRCIEGSRRLAVHALSEAIDDLRRGGHEVVACGLLLASGRPLPGLAGILASHALIHAADGEHFREALLHAAGGAGLRVMTAREKEIWALASAELLLPIEELQDRIAALGKPLGPPWTQDQKLAALMGWMALAGGKKERGGG